MQVNELIEFLEYSDRQASVVVGIAGENGHVSACEEVLFLKQDNRVYLIVDPVNQSSGETATTDAIRLAEFERPQLFGHDFVLLRKPPDHSS